MNDPKKLSKCCSATFHVEGGAEGTNHYECDKCGKPTDPKGGYGFGDPKKPENWWKDEVGTLVRDFTQVGSIPKSEGEKRIKELMDKQRRLVLMEVRKMVKKQAKQRPSWPLEDLLAEFEELINK